MTTYITNACLVVSSVFGMINFPVSSATGAMFIAQSMVAMLIKSESMAMYRPTQILFAKGFFSLVKYNLVDRRSSNCRTLARIPIEKDVVNNLGNMDENGDHTNDE